MNVNSKCGLIAPCIDYSPIIFMIDFVSKNGMLCPLVRSPFCQINSVDGIKLNLLLSQLSNDSTKQLNS